MAMVCSMSFWGGRGPFTPMTCSCNRKGCSIYELQLQQETLYQNSGEMDAEIRADMWQLSRSVKLSVCWSLTLSTRRPTQFQNILLDRRNIRFDDISVPGCRASWLLCISKHTSGCKWAHNYIKAFHSHKSQPSCNRLNLTTTVKGHSLPGAHPS